MHDISIYIATHAFTLALLALAYGLGMFFLFFAGRSYFIIIALLIWFPFETLILRYTPIEYYAFAKYIPEIILYSTAVVSWIRYISRSNRLFPKTAVNAWLLLYIIAAMCSLLLKWYNPAIWLLGVRQLTRFVLVFLIIVLENYPYTTLKKFVWTGLVIAVFEAFLALAQYSTHGALDRYLFFSDTVSFEGIQLEGLSQFWAPGQRVFATLGRYDRLGSFLVVMMLMFLPWLYRAQTQAEKLWSQIVFAVMGLALVLTYSRASWISFFVGVFVIAYGVVRDHRLTRVLITVAALGVVCMVGIVFTRAYGGGVLDKVSQTISERATEAFSLYSWKQNYEGYGRFFFLVNTPRMVVRYYPLFGVGPGNYGGGVAAALLNTTWYDRLHLPFGIQNTVGQIDSNWMSIWGEVGTVGLIAWGGLLFTVLRESLAVARARRSVFPSTMAQGLVGVTAAVALLGFFGPYFEMRTLMMYFWLLAGIVLHYSRQENMRFNFLKD